MTNRCNRSSASAATLLTLLIVQTVIHESCAYFSSGPIPRRVSSPAAWSKVTFLSYKVSADDLAFEHDGGDGDNWLTSPRASQEIYHLKDEQQHRQFLEAHRDKMVVIKYYSVSCKACKALEPRFRKLARDNRGTLSHSPIVFAQIPLTHNTDFFQDVLHLQALPAIQIYKAGALMDSFACPPNMFSTLKRKVDYWRSAHAVLPKITESLSSEYFVQDDHDIPLQLSDMFMDDDDDDDDDGNIYEEHAPRNNIIPSPGASEFFASAHDDISLQLSDMFMNDNDDDDNNDDQEELSRTILSSLIHSPTHHDLVPCDDNGHGSSGLIRDDDAPRNNIIRTLGGSNEFLARYGSDIPLQLSDLFLAEEEDDQY